MKIHSRLIIYISAFLIAVCVFSGCKATDDYQLTVYSGNGEMTLLHVNASTSSKKEQILGIREAVQSAEPTEKDMELFAFYPDYIVEIKTPDDEETIKAVVDINDDKVEFYFPDSETDSATIYLSNTSAEDFMTLMETE